MTYPESYTDSVAAADAGTEVVLGELSEGQTFEPKGMRVAYEDGTGTARDMVDLQDGEGGVVLDSVPLFTDSYTDVDSLSLTEIEDKVVVVVGGSADGPVRVTVDGEMITG